MSADIAALAELWRKRSRQYKDAGKHLPAAEYWEVAEAVLALEAERVRLEGASRWTCFHCSETFTTEGAAQDHFGATISAEPGCQLKVSLGAERGLLMALRKTEETLARFMVEDTDTQRAMHVMQTRHSQALQTAEELGYERGLRDNIRAAHELRKADTLERTKETPRE